MSGGGEVRVLLQEAGKESPRMPAWKREILERRKAKGGGSGGAGVAETSPGGAGPQRVNGEMTGNVNGSGGGGPKRDSGPSGGSGRNYTISTASQHFANNKETRPAAAERTTPREDDRQESLVLQESLGPLEDNPFIKLEKERRRRQDREHPARPVQHILELYGSVPGIRTIRAENIIIIESDPDYFPEAGGVKTGSNWQQNGVSTYSSLNDLLDRSGSGVTEIRAKEVVIYDTTLSKSEENLSTLGRPDREVPSYETGEGQGRVTRMLQKFDSNYGKLQKKSHSTENLLDLDCSASSRPRLWPKPQPELVPKPRPGPLVSSPCSSPDSSHPPSPIFQTPWSSKPKPQPVVSEPGSPQRLTGSPKSVSSFRQRFEESGGRGVAITPRGEPDRGLTKPTRERDWEGIEVPPKPKVPCSPETRRARAESPSIPVSSKVASSSPDFEIRPSPKPDLDQIPDRDTQARALANLRLQSRNSFTVIPKRRLAASSATSSPALSGPIKSSPSHRVAEVPTPGVPTSHAPSPTLTPSKRKEEKEQEEKEVEWVPRPSKPEPSPSVCTSPAHPPTSEPLSPSPALTPGPSSPPALSSPPSSPAVPSSPIFSPPARSPIPSDSPAPSPVPPAPSPAPEQPPGDQLPVTNIDDIEVEPPQHVPVPSPMVQRRKGNTFTVVPKRRVEIEAQPSSPEPQHEASTEAPPGSTPPQAPYAQLGSLLKKRYPAVEEIEVIGGYLSLAKSCLSKTGSTGKKLKISFNESSLQSTYEYPSESSVWDSGEDEEEEEEEEKQDGRMSDEQPSMVGRIHIPRPSFTTSPAQTTNSNDLSSYIPKHSVDFSAWQEHKHDDSVYQEDTTSQHTQMTEEVMLTPADSSSLSDYSSEPALYF
ncbi:taperin [Xiphias gladius]|uniref:taperin n=1 Tax=Xiphias gladius TaxID=8245 RepID=UPI001A99EC8F|nr:taperin [Xiphias gladius]